MRVITQKELRAALGGGDVCTDVTRGLHGVKFQKKPGKHSEQYYEIGAARNAMRDYYAQRKQWQIEKCRAFLKKCDEKIGLLNALEGREWDG